MEQTFTVKELLIERHVSGLNRTPDPNMESVLEAGGRVPLSKAPNPQMLTLGPEINWQLIHMCTHHVAPERDKVVKQMRND